MKQQNGRGHFACVTVNTEFISSGIKIVESIIEPVNKDACEVNRRIAPHWINAVLAGVKDCADILFSQDKFSGCKIEVKRMVGVIVDTSEEDLFCAGALATWQAINQNTELPNIHFSNNKWRIQY